MCNGEKVPAGAAVLMWVEKPRSTRLPVRSRFSQVCTPQKQNPSHPALGPVRNVPQLTQTLKEMVSHEGLQTHFWGQNRTRRQGLLAVLTRAGSMRGATGDPCQARTSLRDCDHCCSHWGSDIPVGLWQSTDTPESEFIEKTYNF